MNVLASIGREDLEEVHGVRMLLNIDAQGVKAIDWADENRDDIERLVRVNGALLIRGLRFVGSQQFGAVLKTLFGEELLQYTYRSTPRTELRGNVYTATEYHSDQVIPQHNENAYSNRWPMRIGFLCTTPAEQGGATPICDSRLIYKQVPDCVRDRFEKNGVLYVRNYADIDIPWSEVFQTTEKSDVEEFCAQNHMSCEWVSDTHLRTRQINHASAIHPDTCESVWFNQAHLFHVTSLPEDIRDSLLSSMREEDLPRNTYYGDGSPIDIKTLDLIRSLYEDNQIRFEWQRNDLLLLDNMLFSHGRESYSGNRHVLVGMARIHGLDTH